jgi:hypothetical protein
MVSCRKSPEESPSSMYGDSASRCLNPGADSATNVVSAKRHTRATKCVSSGSFQYSPTFRSAPYTKVSRSWSIVVVGPVQGDTSFINIVRQTRPRARKHDILEINPIPCVGARPNIPRSEAIQIDHLSVLGPRVRSVKQLSVKTHPADCPRHRSSNSR